MSDWKLEFSEKAGKAIEEARLYHPHLKMLIQQHLQALLDFPPARWYRIEFHGNERWFFPEPGQKIRLTGVADIKSHLIRVTRFSVHE